MLINLSVININNNTHNIKANMDCCLFFALLCKRMSIIDIILYNHIQIRIIPMSIYSTIIFEQNNLTFNNITTRERKTKQKIPLNFENDEICLLLLFIIIYSCISVFKLNFKLIFILRKFLIIPLLVRTMLIIKAKTLNFFYENLL